MLKIRIAIADDYSIFRDGLKVGFNRDKNLEVLFEASDGQELMQKLEEVQPDVIVMDIKMPLMDGIEAMKLIRKKYSNNIKILVLTMYDDVKFIIHLMENGANGYLLKNTDPKEIRKAIYSIYESGYYFNDVVTKALLKKLTLKGPVKLSLNGAIAFSERELDVLKMICDEKTATEIGTELFLSPRSVEGIRMRMIEKTGVRNTAGLVMFAIKNGVVE
ncbi:response regulator transcription factor [Pedobacter zeae]|uniref:DNA-binding NarL/FixJ family response regulator n=1 Tax=Pedobacter zeae TaxID=1737356 RepID=A0A7W6KES3_9SPHI|nr:response regulator transcription factor [Pedobacter zeae]MBB4110501.1 DNA-binding NarL/FixJ family response regulator [Pedobacter zeae]GGH18246.1 transcriptional regulatory protein DegU [Pedobacter zeae]